MDDTPLVLAMPRRELFRIHGFTQRVEPAILTSIIADGWYAAPEAVAADSDAKEVRIGILIRRPAAEGDGDGKPQYLVSEDGILLHVSPIPPESAKFGEGLAALRRFAQALGEALLRRGDCRIELVGYCNEDALVECRRCFLLIYRLITAADTAAPEGMSWVPRSALAGLALEPVSALVTEAAV